MELFIQNMLLNVIKATGRNSILKPLPRVEAAPYTAAPSVPNPITSKDSHFSAKRTVFLPSATLKEGGQPGTVETADRTEPGGQRSDTPDLPPWSGLPRQPQPASKNIKGQGKAGGGAHFHFRLKLGDETYAFIFTAKNMEFTEIHLRICSSTPVNEPNQTQWSLKLRQFCPALTSVVFSSVALQV